MTDLDALLAAIKEKPDDDTIRLVYADALEESGDELMAQFIRVQVEISRLRPLIQTVDDQKRKRDQKRNRELLAREEILWHKLVGRFVEVLQILTFSNEASEAMRRYVKPYPWQVNYSDNGESRGPQAVVARGFIDTVICTSANWTQVADAILAKHPVHKVRLTTRPRIIFSDAFGEYRGHIGGENTFERWATYGDEPRRIVPGAVASLESYMRHRWPQVKEWGC